MAFYIRLRIQVLLMWYGEFRFLRNLVLIQFLLIRLIRWFLLLWIKVINLNTRDVLRRWNNIIELKGNWKHVVLDASSASSLDGFTRLCCWGYYCFCENFLLDRYVQLCWVTFCTKLLLKFWQIGLLVLLLYLYMVLLRGVMFRTLSLLPLNVLTFMIKIALEVTLPLKLIS